MNQNPAKTVKITGKIIKRGNKVVQTTVRADYFYSLGFYLMPSDQVTDRLDAAHAR